MKHILPLGQIVLLTTALLLAVCNLHADTMMLLVAWQAVTGCTQVIIALFLTYKFWRATALKEYYVNYWLFVIAAMVLLACTHYTPNFLGILIWFVIPWCIAIYFSVIVCISFYSKNKNHTHER